MSIRYTRNLFLRGLCVVYLFAFISFYIQIPGLYGDNGILPARSLLENSKHQTLSAKVHYQPTLLWLAPYLGLNIHYALDVLALLGSFLAFTGFVSQKFCTVPLFAALWSLYFSLIQIGQVFVTSQYDSLLLEAGFLCILVAPFFPGRKRSGNKEQLADKARFWLVKWLLFRFLLTNGLVKLLSGCPKWWDLTALSYHFESMPLPSPLAWYCHHLPIWLLKLGAVCINVSEIFLPFSFFVPNRSIRFTGFVCQILLQIITVLTGNFNFLNLLIVALLVSLLDDQFFYNRRSTSRISTILSKVFSLFVYGVLLYAVVVLYSLKVKESHVEAQITFTRDQFEYVVKHGLILAVRNIGFISLTFTALRSLYTHFVEGSTVWTAVTSAFSILLFSGISIFLFLASTVPLESLHPDTNSTIEPSLRVAYNRLHKLHILNQYGLFTKMTGTDGRPEIILEGSNDLEGPWLEYNFLYKPGNVNHSLPFVAPYSPRLDWQFWFAAQSSYTKEPWLLSLTHRLLLGRPEVLALLDHSHSPFTAKPPKYIRASIYKYKYSPWNARNQPIWWVREKIGEYFPPYSKDSPALVDYLKARNLLPVISKTPVNPIWKQVLDGIRYVTSHLEATLLLWSVFTAGCAIITTSKTK